MMSENVPYTVSISASFTADHIQAALEFWMPRLNLEGSIQFPGFNQIFQSLLDPGSIFSSASKGLNVALLRWEDLAGTDQLLANGRNLIKTLKETAGVFRVPLLVASCPCSDGFLAEEMNAVAVRQLDSEL